MPRDAQAAVDVGATTFGIARSQDRGLGDSTVARAGFHSSITRTIYHALRGGLCYQDQRARKCQGAAVAGTDVDAAHDGLIWCELPLELPVAVPAGTLFVKLSRAGLASADERRN